MVAKTFEEDYENERKIKKILNEKEGEWGRKNEKEIWKERNYQMLWMTLERHWKKNVANESLGEKERVDELRKKENFSRERKRALSQDVERDRGGKQRWIVINKSKREKDRVPDRKRA